MARLFPLLLLLALGCPGTPVGETDTDTDTDADTDTDVDYVWPINNLRWQVDFDAAAEARGFFDCAYGRSYTRGVEDRSAAWLWPACDSVYRVEVTMHEGWEDCYSQVSSGEPSPTEYHGFGEGRFWRTYYDNYLLSDQGEATPIEDGHAVLNVTEAYDLEGGGTFTFTVHGELETGQGAADPMHGYTPPEEYACGWPKADPAPWEGPWTMEISGPMPDGFFKDSCDEPVRLHDFAGHYLVLDVSATDCGPCRTMASEEHAFTEGMADLEAGVEVITFMAPTLSAVLDPTPQSTLLAWMAEYGLESPVLADRGYGYWTIAPLVGEDFGYPTWVVVAPDLEILEAGVGFSSGSWSGIEDIIRGHAAR